MKEQSWFGEGKRDKGSGDGVLTKAGKGVVVVGTVIGAGILCGMGFSAFENAANSID